jgi:hypothetical protein
VSWLNGPELTGADPHTKEYSFRDLVLLVRVRLGVEFAAARAHEIASAKIVERNAERGAAIAA